MLLRSFVSLLVLILCSTSFAGALPSFLRDGSTRFLYRSFGSACYSMDSVERGLPCNPAFVAKIGEQRFDGDLFLGTNMDYIRDADAMVNGTADQATVAKIFSRRDVSQAEASLEASYLAHTWGVSLEPYRMVFYTRFENPSLPAIDFVAAEEQSAKLQLSSYVSKNFYAGLQLRYTHVRFVGDYFMASEAFAGDSQKLFAPKIQELLYVEPGFVYAWEDLVWQPQVSAMLSGWGMSSVKSDQYPMMPQGLLGTSIKPVVPLGLLEVGVQLDVSRETEYWRDAFRAAISYKLGILQFVVSASDYDHSAGFLLAYKNLTSGLSYWSEPENKGVYISFGVTL
ncbi:MAG: hypothetical protein J7501_06830 [Bdellovibrio sp.]|nr:hypothetical protein [Bdellovibrio sp.]